RGCGTPTSRGSKRVDSQTYCALPARYRERFRNKNGDRAPSCERNRPARTRGRDERVLRISAWFATSAEAGRLASERRLVPDRRGPVASLGRGRSWRLAEFAPCVLYG